MNRVARFTLLALVGLAPFAVAQAKPATPATRVALGRLTTGATVSFVRAGSGDWGLEITGDGVPRLAQQQPVQIEVFRAEDQVSQLASGYQTVQALGSVIVATASVKGTTGPAAFAVVDRWTLSGAVLSLSRTVRVTGAEPAAGFSSAIRLSTSPSVTWTDIDFLAPGLLYGEPRTSASAPGGSLPYRSRRIDIREDYSPAPVFALSLRDGNWTAVMNLAPRGDTTQAETTAPASTPVIDARLQFGALGARETPAGGVEYGFWMPARPASSRAGSARAAAAAPLPPRRTCGGAITRSPHVSRRVTRSDSGSASTRRSARRRATPGDGHGRS
jgi:hypothetical protein